MFLEYKQSLVVSKCNSFKFVRIRFLHSELFHRQMDSTTNSKLKVGIFFNETGISFQLQAFSDKCSNFSNL